MIEAVGWQYFDTYFRRCSELLEPDGLMLLQAITADDRVYKTEKASKSFINTLIFPGGCLPSLEVIHDCLASETDMRTVWLDDITHHYSETLRRWREDFVAARRRGRCAGLRPALQAHVGAVSAPTWRPASPSGVSATSRCCWPSPSGGARCPTGSPASTSRSRSPQLRGSRLNIRSGDLVK